MNAILDVGYKNERAFISCVQFLNWYDDHPSAKRLTHLDIQAKYVPGRFFERELPCLLFALKQETVEFEVIVIDGFVHLKPPLKKGLGYYLYESMPYSAAVIGVAKNPLKVADSYVPVLRGKSCKPLFVSSINFSTDRAAELIKNMHGPFRLPTLIKMADGFCKDAVRFRF